MQQFHTQLPQSSALLDPSTSDLVISKDNVNPTDELLTSRRDKNYRDNILDCNNSDLVLMNSKSEESAKLRSKSESLLRDVYTPLSGGGVRSQSAENQGMSSGTLASTLSSLNSGGGFKKFLDYSEEKIQLVELDDGAENEDEDSGKGLDDVPREEIVKEKEIDDIKEEEAKHVQTKSKAELASVAHHPQKKMDKVASPTMMVDHFKVSSKEPRKVNDPPSGSQNRAIEKERRASISRNMAMQAASAQKRRSSGSFKGRRSQGSRSQGQRSQGQRSTKDESDQKGNTINHKIVSSGTTNVSVMLADSRSIQVLKRKEAAKAERSTRKAASPSPEKPGQQRAPPVRDTRIVIVAEHREVGRDRRQSRTQVESLPHSNRLSGRVSKTSAVETSSKGSYQTHQRMLNSKGSATSVNRQQRSERRGDERGNSRKSSRKDLTTSRQDLPMRTKRRLSRESSVSNGKLPAASNGKVSVANGIQMSSTSSSSIDTEDYEARYWEEDFEDDSVVGCR